MATSKTYSKTCSAVGGYSYAGNFKLYVKLEEKEVNTSANTSKVKYTVYCESSGSGSISAKHFKYFKINGSTKIDETVSVSASSPNAYISIVSGTTGAITHNSDGSKSISFEAEIEASSYGVKASISNTFALSNIPRYATANQSLNSKTSSSIKMNWWSDSTIDGIWYSTNNGSSWNWVTDPRATSGTYTISGLAANTTYNIKTRVKRYDSQLTTDSGTLSVTTYAKTIPTISLSSKTINSISVSSGCNVAVSSTQYRIKTSSGSYGAYQTSATFSGLNPNTAYVIEVLKVGSDSKESGTATLSVTTYDYAKASVYPNITMGSAFTLKINKPDNEAARLDIEFLKTDGNYDYTLKSIPLNQGNNDYTVNFTDSELDTIYKYLGTRNSMKIRYSVITINKYWDIHDVTITLIGNQKTGHINISNSWKRTKKWININGTWKRCVRWVNVNGTWKRCI